MQSSVNTSHTTLVGVGSAHGDDQVGWLVLREIEPHAPSDIRIVYARTPVDVLHVPATSRLVVVDSCLGAGAEGTVHHWRWPDVPALVQRPRNSHDWDLFEVLRLQEMLRPAPAASSTPAAAVSVWGIEVALSQPRQTVAPHLSEALRPAIRTAALQILGELCHA